MKPSVIFPTTFRFCDECNKVHHYVMRSNSTLYRNLVNGFSRECLCNISI